MNFRFRVDVVTQHSLLMEKLSQLRTDCENVRKVTDFMDLDHMLELKDANNSISIKLQQMDEDVQRVALLMESFAQYLPKQPHR